MVSFCQIHVQGISTAHFIDKLAPIGICLLSQLVDKCHSKCNGEIILKNLEVIINSTMMLE